ncbi:hypothetical protein HanIR_Chr01g0006911 [Helianthus annuus]|nr:hypothetical protein HanIR_Chr01g0006911 [Helianthus annuus]
MSNQKSTINKHNNPKQHDFFRFLSLCSCFMFLILSVHLDYQLVSSFNHLNKM